MLIGVDGGADALIAAGYRPDLIVGDLESVTDDALRSGAEIVLRRSPDGRTPGMQRVAQLNLPAVAVTAAATAEDFALLLADAAGADLIVTVGAHAGLAEFLDQGRTAAASSFLTRLKVGGILVDAATVGRLHRTRSPSTALVLLAGASAVTTAAGVLAVGYGSTVLSTMADRWDDLMSALQRLL